VAIIRWSSGGGCVGGHTFTTRANQPGRMSGRCVNSGQRKTASCAAFRTELE
jgi:hypothetical protein